MPALRFRKLGRFFQAMLRFSCMVYRLPLSSILTAYSLPLLVRHSPLAPVYSARRSFLSPSTYSVRSWCAPHSVRQIPTSSFLGRIYVQLTPYQFNGSHTSALLCPSLAPTDHNPYPRSTHSISSPTCRGVFPVYLRHRLRFRPTCVLPESVLV